MWLLTQKKNNYEEHSLFLLNLLNSQWARKDNFWGKKSPRGRQGLLTCVWHTTAHHGSARHLIGSTDWSCCLWGGILGLSVESFAEKSSVSAAVRHRINGKAPKEGTHGLQGACHIVCGKYMLIWMNEWMGVKFSLILQIICNKPFITNIGHKYWKTNIPY